MHRTCALKKAPRFEFLLCVYVHIYIRVQTFCVWPIYDIKLCLSAWCARVLVCVHVSVCLRVGGGVCVVCVCVCVCRWSGERLTLVHQMKAPGGGLAFGGETDEDLIGRGQRQRLTCGREWGSVQELAEGM